jgi:gamma-glutamylputrescine synthase
MEALKLFKNNKILAEYLGEEFMQLWCTVKQAEYQSVHSQITSIEKSWDI